MLRPARYVLFAHACCKTEQRQKKGGVLTKYIHCVHYFMAKTNKSYTKRLRVTRNKKIIARSPGQDHFNAKEPRSAQLKQKRTVKFKLSNKNRGRYFN